MSDYQVDYPLVLNDILESFLHFPGTWQRVTAAIVLVYAALPHLLETPTGLGVATSAFAVFFAFGLGVSYAIVGVHRTLPEVITCENCEGGEPA